MMLDDGTGIVRRTTAARAILSRRSALNLCGIYSILKNAGRYQYQWSGGPLNNAVLRSPPGHLTLKSADASSRE
jgi:hypothetical protein